MDIRTIFQQLNEKEKAKQQLEDEIDALEQEQYAQEQSIKDYLETAGIDIFKLELYSNGVVAMFYSEDLEKIDKGQPDHPKMNAMGFKAESRRSGYNMGSLYQIDYNLDDFLANFEQLPPLAIVPRLSNDIPEERPEPLESDSYS